MLSDVTYMWSGFGLHGFIDRSLHLFSVWIQLKEKKRESYEGKEVEIGGQIKRKRRSEKVRRIQKKKFERKSKKW